jgi:hypothetical protein
MEQGGYLNEDANISDFTEVNLSVPRGRIVYIGM